MRTVIQRVSHAGVDIPATGYSAAIGRGLLVLCAFEEGDGTSDLEWMAGKIARLRIFDDQDGVMNLSVTDTGGEIMVISQFTLYAKTARGNRPSYIRAAKPDIAIPLYEQFCAAVSNAAGRPVATGVFGADMKVSLLNDGPVTIIIDSKQGDI